MEWGEHLPLLKDLEKRGKAPKALQNQPPLPWSLHHFLTDFQTLSGFRTYGFSGPNPIDIPSIFFYCQIMGIENPQRFLRVMKKLDTIYLGKSYEHNSGVRSKSDGARGTNKTNRRSK